MEETVLQGMTETLTEIGRYYEMEMYVGKTKVMRISSQPFPVQIKIDLKQLQNMEYFNHLGSMITNDASCTCKIKSRTAMAKAAFNKKKTLFPSKVDLNLRKKLVKCYTWSIPLNGAETWTLQNVDQKYLETFEMWCWRRMEEISWIDRVRNEEESVTEERNILYTIKRKKANWIRHILHRNCLLKHIIGETIDGRTEVAANQAEDVSSYWITLKK
jgi:hypothetical protein